MPNTRISTKAKLAEIDSSLRNRILRVRSRMLYILQASIAAGFAYWFAIEVAGHAKPFFAPMAVVIILGTSGGDRLRKAVELTFGCAIGVGLGDIIIVQIGSGYWQMFVIVALSLFVASFVANAPLVSNQVAIGAILIATIMPPGNSGGFERTTDALIGGVIGILVIALLPTSPLQAGRQQIANILGIASSVLSDVAAALETKDPKLLSDALDAIRQTQGDVDKMASAAVSGKEAATLSPFLWSNRARIRSLFRIIAPVDNTVRNVRVLARRALILTEDGDEVSQAQIEVIKKLSGICFHLSEVYEHPKEVSEAIEIPGIVKQLRLLGSEVGLEVAEGRVLSAQVVLAQSRSIIVDLLQVCGMSRESSAAILLPTSETPAHPPELWYE